MMADFVDPRATVEVSSSLDNVDETTGYHPEWASSVDDRGNVFYVEPTVSPNSRANIFSTPQAGTQRRSRRSPLSPSVSLSYGLGLSVTNTGGGSYSAQFAAASRGPSAGGKSSHGEQGEKRGKLMSMWKNLTGQRRGSSSGGNSAGADTALGSEEAGNQVDAVTYSMATPAVTGGARTAGSLAAQRAAQGAVHERGVDVEALERPVSMTLRRFTVKLPDNRSTGDHVSLEALGITAEIRPRLALETLDEARTADGGVTGAAQKPGEKESMLEDSSGSVSILSIAPGSAASLASTGGGDRLHLGDVIAQINGVNVSEQNLSSILAAVSGEREICIQIERQGAGKSGRIRPSPSSQQLLSLLRGKRHSPYLVRDKDGQLGTQSPNIHVKTKTVPHGLMYLTLSESKSSNKEDTSMDDVLYHYPSSAEGGEGIAASPITRLLCVRGLFLTLADILQSVTGTTTSSSLINIDGRAIHVGYLQLGENLLVLLLPAASSPLFYLDCVMEDVDRLLTITFGSIHGAFTKKRHKGRLDQLFSLVFERLLSRDRDGYHHITDALHGIHRLPIPFEIRAKISSALSEMEADDHSGLDEVLYLRRPFLILGTCLFYKGYVVESHLPEEDTQDLALYCRYYCLLQLSARQRLGQLVIWHEIFLSRRGHLMADSQPDDPGYVEQTGRTFLLIVGFNHALMCVILEAGATTAKVTGHPGPVPYYVDSAEEVLSMLSARGLLQACDSRIQMAPVPAVITAHQALKSASNSHPALLKFAQQHGIKATQKDEDSDASNIASGSPGLSRAIFMQKAALPPGSAAAGFRKAVRHGPKLSSSSPKPLASLAHSLTAGEGNLLFHYINVDAVAGVMVCPLVQHVRAATVTSSASNPSVHGQLVRTFHRTCIVIREVLCRRCMQEPPDNQFSRQNSLRGVYEHGVLLQINPAADNKAMGRSAALGDKQRNTVSMNYWVVGRLFREPVQREFYVCFQESMSQNVVELAFKLCFGAVT